LERKQYIKTKFIPNQSAQIKTLNEQLDLLSVNVNDLEQHDG